MCELSGPGAGDLLMARVVDRETLCDAQSEGLTTADRRALECCTPDGRLRADYCRLQLEFDVTLPQNYFQTCRVTVRVCSLRSYAVVAIACPVISDPITSHYYITHSSPPSLVHLMSIH